MDESIVEIISREEAIERGLTHFFTGKPCIYGHVAKRYVSSKQCFICNDERLARSRIAKWKHSASREQMEIDRLAKRTARANGETTYVSVITCKNGHTGLRYAVGGSCVACSKEWARNKWLQDPDGESAKRKSRRQNNLDAERQRDREYYRLNKASRSKKHVALRRKKRQEDPVYAIKHRVRGLVSNAIRGFGYGKRTKTADIIGCSWDYLKAHIERQFLPGMSWENRERWHIDHIIPLATAKTEADVIALNHVSNLRPMWGPDNIKKSDKVLFLI